jgi:hypothetical protein
VTRPSRRIGNVLGQLYENLREFRRKAAQIAIRIGRDTELSRTCDATSEYALGIAQRVEACLFMREAKEEDVKEILDEGRGLDRHREAYIDGANAVPGSCRSMAAGSLVVLPVVLN